MRTDHAKAHGTHGERKPRRIRITKPAATAANKGLKAKVAAPKETGSENLNIKFQIVSNSKQEEQIQDLVEAELQATPELKNLKLKAEVHNRNVILKGLAHRALERGIAQRIASEVPGVLSVTNEIQLGGGHAHVKTYKHAA